MCNTQFSPLNSKRVILELCVLTFTCEHVYVVLATLASASPREIQDKLLALQRLLCFFLVFCLPYQVSCVRLGLHPSHFVLYRPWFDLWS